MARRVTIFTGQFADLPFEKVCETMAGIGYDGLEIATWGDHLDIEKAAKSKAYCADRKATLAKYNRGCWAIGTHLTGQLVCDVYDKRHDAFAPAAVRGKPKEMRAWAVKTMKLAAKAAKNMGAGVVTGFTGSPLWPYLYSFPPTTPEMIAAGYREFAKAWKPIIDVYADNGVKFALEVHPTEIAFDTASAARALEALDGHPAATGTSARSATAMSSSRTSSSRSTTSATRARSPSNGKTAAWTVSTVRRNPARSCARWTSRLRALRSTAPSRSDCPAARSVL